jgi:hypothetical protein
VREFFFLKKKLIHIKKVIKNRSLEEDPSEKLLETICFQWKTKKVNEYIKDVVLYRALLKFYIGFFVITFFPGRIKAKETIHFSRYLQEPRYERNLESYFYNYFNRESWRKYFKTGVNREMMELKKKALTILKTTVPNLIGLSVGLSLGYTARAN